MAANTYDLRAILSDEDALVALVRIFERGWDRVLAALALGIGRPDSARTRQLLAKLRSILAGLDPRKDSAVRHWVREWVRRAYFSGEETSLAELPSKKGKAPAKTVVDSMANAIATLDQKLAAVVDAMSAAATGAALAAHRAILANPDLRGGLSTPEGRSINAALQALVLNGIGDVSPSWLVKGGIPRSVIDMIDRLNRGVITIGKGSLNILAYVKQTAGDVLGHVHNAASMHVGEENGVDHVLIGKEETRNICRFCDGVEFRVFYNGPEAVDPNGFPNLRDLPPDHLSGRPGPKWHFNCVHVLLPWDITAKSKAEIDRERAASLAVPAEWFGPAGTVEKVNGTKHYPMRKLA